MPRPVTIVFDFALPQRLPQFQICRFADGTFAICDAKLSPIATQSFVDEVIKRLHPSYHHNVRSHANCLMLTLYLHNSLHRSGDIASAEEIKETIQIAIADLRAYVGEATSVTSNADVTN